MDAAKNWLKNNWFSIFASTLAFILSTAVNQGIDWYKDRQVQGGTIAGLLNETKNNISSAEIFNRKNLAYQGDCKVKITVSAQMMQSLNQIPVSFSSDYYSLNSQKVSELNKKLLNDIYAVYNEQKLIMDMTATLYAIGPENNESVANEVLSHYCSYQKKLQHLYKKLNE